MQTDVQIQQKTVYGLYLIFSKIVKNTNWRMIDSSANDVEKLNIHRLTPVSLVYFRCLLIHFANIYSMPTDAVIEFVYSGHLLFSFILHLFPHLLIAAFQFCFGNYTFPTINRPRDNGYQCAGICPNQYNTIHSREVVFYN